MLAPVCALASCAGPQDPLEGVPAFAVDHPSVTLIDAGADPQQLDLAAGDAGDTAQWDITVAVSQGFAQQVVPADAVDTHAPQDAPADTTTLPLSVSSGEAPAPGADEEAAQRLVHVTVGEHPDVASAAGFEMAWRASATGAVSTVKLLAPDDSTEQDRQAVERALLTVLATNVVVPEQPVGVGGSWSVDTRVTGADAMRRTTIYTVANIEGDRITLDVQVHERPARDSVSIDNDIAGELDGQTLTVDSSETTSQGQIVVSRAAPLPVSGTVEATTRVVYAGPDPVTRVVQDITTAIEYGT